MAPDNVGFAANCMLQHYDFHHFMLNRTLGYNNTPIFPYSSDPTAATPQHLLPATNQIEVSQAPMVESDSATLKTASDLRLEKAAQAAAPTLADSDLEGFSDDPSLTKVVDRRWYERSKHIYPMSTWEEFDAGRDYNSTGGGFRKDGEGNAYFFGR